MTDPADLTLVELLPLLERRELSAVELLEACLARAEAHEQRVRAFVVLTPERARAAAEQADADRAAGRPVGPLAGVPVALKDLYLTAGVPTTASSRVVTGHDPDVDAAVWERLRDAGAGLLGKTTTHEFAYGTGSHPTRNPWDLTRTPGGSSGGSAAALATRMVPVATGTDTGGSLRIPAAACGVTSLRTALGRVSTSGVLPLGPSLDVPGPMARRLRDVALLMRVVAGPDPRDPRSLPGPVPDYPDAPADVRGLRLGRVRWPGEGDPQVTAACDRALARLAERGAEVVELAPPPGSDAVMAVPGAYGLVVGYEAAQVHRRWLAEQPEAYGEQVRERLRGAVAVTAEQYAAAQEERARWTAQWRELLQDRRIDAVAHETNPLPPATLDSGELPSVAPCKAWSLTGWPALSVPVGRDDRGLPVGLQLAGLPEREADLLGLGIAVDEDHRSWEHSPPL